MPESSAENLEALVENLKACIADLHTAGFPGGSRLVHQAAQTLSILMERERVLRQAMERIGQEVFVAEPAGTPDSAWRVALNERIQIARSALNHRRREVMDKPQFDQLTDELLERMDKQLGEWAEEEPVSDWWSEQRDYQLARDTILALRGA